MDSDAKRRNAINGSIRYKGEAHYKLHLIIFSVNILAVFLAYMREILYLCKWISVRHTFQKLFKI